MTTISQAIAFFVDDIERAKADLANEINRLFPEHFIEISLDSDEDVDDQGRITVAENAVESCPSDDIEAAFVEFDRELNRRLRELKEALRHYCGVSTVEATNGRCADLRAFADGRGRLRLRLLRLCDPLQHPERQGSGPESLATLS